MIPAEILITRHKEAINLLETIQHADEKIKAMRDHMHKFPGLYSFTDRQKAERDIEICINAKERIEQKYRKINMH